MFAVVFLVIWICYPFLVSTVSQKFFFHSTPWLSREKKSSDWP